MQTEHASDIAKVTLLRPASVTHSFDQSQRIKFLAFQANAATLTVTAPATPSICPPGPYMLFIVDTAGIPSVAQFIQMQPVTADRGGGQRAALRAAAPSSGRHRRSDIGAYATSAAAAVDRATGTAVLVTSAGAFAAAYAL